MSGLDAAVPEQREQQPNANRQRAKADHEQGEAPEGRKRPETGPRDDTKERERPRGGGHGHHHIELSVRPPDVARSNATIRCAASYTRPVSGTPPRGARTCVAVANTPISVGVPWAHHPRSPGESPMPSTPRGDRRTLVTSINVTRTVFLVGTIRLSN